MMSGRPVVAYLPVFCHSDSGTYQKERAHCEMLHRKMKTDRMNTIHESIAFHMAPFATVTRSGVPLVTMDSPEVHIRFISTSYNSKLSVAEYILSVRNASVSKYSSIQASQKRGFSNCTIAEPQTLLHTSYFMERFQSSENDTKAEEDLKPYSQLSTPPLPYIFCSKVFTIWSMFFIFLDWGQYIQCC